MRVLLTCFLAIATAACSSLSTGFDYDTSADFSALSAYGWIEDEGSSQAMSLALQRARTAVDAELGARGYRLDPQAPDFLVSVHVTSQERVQVTDWGYSYGRHGAWYGSRDLDVYTYDEGSLVIDVVDPTRRALIWRGTASRVVEPDWSPDEREKVVREAVQALLEDFPPGGGR
jgi:hypothetical protein